MNTCASAISLYPDEEWGRGFQDLHLPGTVAPESVLFDLYSTRLDRWNDGSCADECADLRSLQEKRTEQDRVDIVFQAAGSFGAVTPVLSAVGINTDHPVVLPELKELRKRIVASATCEVFRWKRHFLRPRPWHVCKPLDPMFFDGDTTHLRPLHASYPSGHSTIAHLFAHLLTEVFPDAGNRLLDAASAVAKKREIAGVHFKSDSEGGAALATQIMLAMKDHPRWGSDVLPVLKSLVAMEAQQRPH